MELEQLVHKAYNLHLEHKEQEAEELLQIACRLWPDQWIPYVDLASIELLLKKETLALEYLNQAEKLGCPAKALLYNNKGFVYKNLGDMKKAIECCHTAVEADKDFMDAYNNLGVCYALDGNWDLGYYYLEYRFKSNKRIKESRTRYKAPDWDGETELVGKRILVYNEQGRGDEIQNIRFLPWLKQRDCTIILECREECKTLFEKCEGIDQIVIKNSLAKDLAGELVPSIDEELGCDYVVSMNSFPYLFHIGPTTVPNTFPYITPQKTNKPSQDYWRGFDGKFKVGICWSGSPTHPEDRYRSFSGNLFENIKIPGVELFSLQFRGYQRPDLQPTKLFFHDLDCSIDNLNDLANIIQHMDLVISTDSVPAHLAGALGKPVWTLVYRSPDYRWGLNTFSTPWYPSMTIVRESQGWESLFKELTKAITSALARIPR